MKFKIEEILKESLIESLEIVGMVFILMILIELIVIKSRKILQNLAKRNNFFSYILSAVSGVIPNCSPTFAMGSLYMSGYLSFGGLIAVMVTTIDDVGLLVFSKTFTNDIPVHIIVYFFGGLIITGIIGGWIADVLSTKLKWQFKAKCDIEIHKEEGHNLHFNLNHFIKEHIWKHILKKHILKIFVWTFIILVLIEILQSSYELEKLINDYKPYFILIAAMIGILPSPAPNFFIFNVFAKEPISMFSVFLTNSIVQDGHGLLPIIGYSFRDAIKVKVFKIVLALIIGFSLYFAGF